MSTKRRSWSDQQKKIKFIWYSTFIGIPLLIISGLLFYDYYTRTDQYFEKNYCTECWISGLYVSEFPRFSIEINRGSEVRFSYYYGDRKSPSCVTKGRWEIVGMNNPNETYKILITLEGNQDCDVDFINGEWLWYDCKKFDGDDTKCISMGTSKLILNNK